MCEETCFLVLILPVRRQMKEAMSSLRPQGFEPMQIFRRPSFGMSLMASKVSP